MYSGVNHRPDISERLRIHRIYWQREEQPYPLAAFRVEKDFFFSRHFEAARSLLIPGKQISPDMLSVEKFLPDYERMFQVSEELGQDAFWTAEPFTGIPWMEAILGCEIHAAEESFISKPWLKDLAQVEELQLDPRNPWLQKYLEFTDALVAFSKGRFPVGMPIMRGPSDMVGALMGQAEMVYALQDDPARMKALFLKVTDMFLQVQELQCSRLQPFYGGWSLGFYHVWCPGPSIWYQDDLSALLSPELFREFLSATSRRICEGFSYTAVHLHPASFFLLEEILSNEKLTAVEVNKDVGGPSVEEMLPQLHKILTGKNLILWGDLTIQDLEVIRKRLPLRGLFFHIIAPSMEEAREILRFIRNWRN